MGICVELQEIEQANIRVHYKGWLEVYSAFEKFSILFQHWYHQLLRERFS